MQVSTRIQRLFEGLLIAGFLAALFLPMLDILFGFDDTPAPKEKRLLTSLPKWPRTLTALEEYPQRFDAFYNDHFGFRNYLVFLHNLLQIKWFPDSQKVRVLVGKKPWLFYKDERAIDYYRGLEPFTREELEAWRLVLEERRDWCRAREIEYAVFFAPMKHTIYSEYLPDYIKKASGQTRLDQLLEYLATHSDLLVIDVRSDLLEAKKTSRVYYWTDSHWNNRGIFHAYTAVIKSLASLLPDLEPPYDISLFEPGSMETAGLDLAKMLGLQEMLREEHLTLKPKVPWPLVKEDGVLFSSSNNASARKPLVLVNRLSHRYKALVFGDSFLIGLDIFFALNFSRSVYFRNDRFNPSVIESEAPDVVITELVERKLLTAEPTNPPELNR